MRGNDRMHEERNQIIGQLYDQFYDSIFQLCETIANHNPQFHSLIEDCIQDAFVKALLYYEDFKDYTNPMGWIAVAARNRLQTEIRKQRIRRRHIYLLFMSYKQALLFAEKSDNMLARIELADQIAVINKTLTKKEKIIFTEYFVKRNRMKEIVKDTGLSHNSVRSGIRRIRKKHE